MIRSMTGFGEATTTREGVHYSLEVRSLNSKYFKANIRLPESLQALEPVVESALRRRLTRGTVTAIVRCSDQSAGAAYGINHEALSRYVTQLREVSEVRDGLVTVDTASLLQLPGVLLPPGDTEGTLAQGRDVLEGLVDEACKHLVSMREREGVMLADELRTHAEKIRAELEVVVSRVPDVVQVYETRMRTRVDQMLEDAGVSAEPVDLIREVAIYAEKSDITEEIARLGAHLKQFRDLLANADNQPVGRTMDFLSQELLREANTIASKSSDADISRCIVTIKSLIDRIKEQVQNVE